MSPSPRPASAPSNLRNASVEPDNAANYPRAFGQWTSTRGRRPEFHLPQRSPTTVQLQDENLGPDEEGISPASQSIQHAQETADGSAANHVLSNPNRVDPWKEKTLLTSGTVVMECIFGDNTDIGTRRWRRSGLLEPFDTS